MIRKIGLMGRIVHVITEVRARYSPVTIFDSDVRPIKDPVDASFFSIHVEAAGDLRVKGEVKLKRYVETKHDIPTDARWSSFGWIINGEVETRKLP